MSNPVKKDKLDTLQQRLKLFAPLLRASSDGIAITDAAQNIVQINAAFCAFVGQPRRDVLETNLRVWLAQLDDDSPRRWSKLEQHTRHAGACHNIEFQMTQRDMPRHFSVNAALLEQASDAEIDLIISIWRDVTERVRTEATLRTSMEIQDAVLSTTNVLLAYMDRDFNFITVNQAYADAGHRQRENLVGQNHFDLYPHAENEAIFSQVVETGIAQFFSAKPFQHPDQPERETTYWDWSLIPSLDESGRVRALVMSVLDVTERVRAELALAVERQALQKAHDKLELRVAERTADLAQANTALRVEIAERKQAEQALAEKTMYLDNILRSATEYAIVTTDLNFHITYYNPLAEQFFGHTAADVIGKTIQEMHTRERVAPQRFEKAIANVRAHGEYRYRLVQKGDTGTRYLNSRISGIYDADNELVGLALFSHDITARVRAEAKIARLATVVEQATVTVVITDLEGDIIYANPDFETSTGYTVAEALGQNPHILKSDRQDASFYQKLWATIVAGRTWHGIFINKRKNGKLYHEEATIFPIKNAGGEIVNYAAVKRDVTERVLAEQTLRASEERFRTVANFTHDWEYWVNPAGNYIYVSPACERITGYRADEFIQNPDLLKNIVHPDDQSRVMAHNHTVTETGEILPLDFRIVTRSGEERWIGHVCQPVHSNDGRYLGQRGSNRDITARKQVEKTLRQRNRELTLFNSASHAFVSSLNLDQVLTTILDQVRQIIGIMACSIWLVDPENGDLVCREVASPKDDAVRGWRLAPGQGLAGWVVQHGESLNIPDSYTDQRHFKGVDQQTGLKLRSILGVPLRTKNGILGVLQLVDAADNRFSPSDVRLAELLAALAAIAIENARLYRQTQADAITKALLLREINHRVSNNLTGILGLLYSARQHITAKAPTTYHATMDDLIIRVNGLATVHSMLSASKWAPLQLSELAAAIIHSVLQARPCAQPISLDVPPAPVRVTSKQAHHLALVLNELATNAIKYAVAEGEHNVVCITCRITLDAAAPMVRIEFRDNGPGYPPDVLQLKQHNVGFDLIKNIVRKNLRGELTLHNDHGAVVVIRFPNKV